MLTGIASNYDYQSPLDPRLVITGINQEEEPWWFTQILGWLLMVRQIGECPTSGDGLTFKGPLRAVVDGRLDPNKLYEQYRKFKDYIERISNETSPPK